MVLRAATPNCPAEEFSGDQISEGRVNMVGVQKLKAYVADD